MLTITSQDAKTGLSTFDRKELEVNSDKWRKFLDFMNQNEDNWQASPASYIGDIIISQANFKLIHFKESNGIVIVFTDKEGKP